MVVQWLRICPAMQGTQVQSLVWEDSTSLGATKLLSQLLKPVWSKVFAIREASTRNEEQRPHPTPPRSLPTGESPPSSKEDSAQSNKIVQGCS